MRISLRQKCVAVVVFLLSPQLFAGEFELISSGTLNAEQVRFLRALEKSDSRQNPDGSLFYRTTYKIEFTANGKTHSQIIESDLYTPEDPGWNGMWPSLLIDPESQVITLFSNGKDPNYNYSMVGYAYRFDSSRQWTKEVVFPSGNFGWFAYFGGSSAGNPELWHFSYAGYRQLRSVRNPDGTWHTADMGGLEPSQASANQDGRKKILMASTHGVQTPWKGKSDAELQAELAQKQQAQQEFLKSYSIKVLDSRQSSERAINSSGLMASYAGSCVDIFRKVSITPKAKMQQPVKVTVRWTLLSTYEPVHIIEKDDPEHLERTYRLNASNQHGIQDELKYECVPTALRVHHVGFSLLGKFMGLSEEESGINMTLTANKFGFDVIDVAME